MQEPDTIKMLREALDVADRQLDTLVARLQRHHGDEREICAACFQKFIPENSKSVLGTYGDEV